MPKTRGPIMLREAERQQVQHYGKDGKRSARAIPRARILVLADEQRAEEEIALLLEVNRTTGHRVRKSYRERGLDHTLTDQPRSGAPAKIDGRVEARLTMLACAAPPEGYGRWTRQSRADRLVA
jgi:transposase